MSTDISTFDAKKGFLLSQIRILSQETLPDPEWQEDCPQTEDGDLTKNAVDNILQKVNQLSKRHNQLVYSSMAVDHVSEQIDALYWDENSRDSGNSDIDVLSGRFDLTDPQNIDLLPEAWPNESEGTEEQKQEYHNLVGHISNMATGITGIRVKHAQLLALRAKLEPFANPIDDIQPNLVSKDGELAIELNKTRILAAKLANTLEASKDQLRKTHLNPGMHVDTPTNSTDSISLMRIHGL